jgi:hypothetical protein
MTDDGSIDLTERLSEAERRLHAIEELAVRQVIFRGISRRDSVTPS